MPSVSRGGGVHHQGRALAWRAPYAPLRYGTPHPHGRPPLRAEEALRQVVTVATAAAAKLGSSLNEHFVELPD